MRTMIFRTFLFSIFLLTFFNEYCIYVIKSIISWPEIKCNSVECTKILFVADSQILGENNENTLTILDCDRYLRNTFSVALDYTKPDGVIFLGDLTDEGSVATDEQFARYYDRFKSIFRINEMKKSGIPTVFIPGDNDIGGEGNEIIRAEVVKRFRGYFANEEIKTVKDVQVFNVNKLLRTYPSAEDKLLNENSKLNLAISHVPLTIYPSPFTAQVIRDVKPEFIISAHEHKSFALVTQREYGERLLYKELKENNNKNNELSWSFKTARSANYSTMTEIIVPTCSYRMGVTEMGYGVVVYGKNSSEIVYYVLWLPSRFILLISYLIFFIIWTIILWINVRYLRRYHRKRYLC